MTLGVGNDKEFKRTYTNSIDNIIEKTPEKHQCDDCGQGINSHMRLINHNQGKRMNLNLPDLINSKILVILMIPLILLNRIRKKSMEEIKKYEPKSDNNRVFSDYNKKKTIIKGELKPEHDDDKNMTEKTNVKHKKIKKKRDNDYAIEETNENVDNIIKGLLSEEERKLDNLQFILTK